MTPLTRGNISPFFMAGLQQLKVIGRSQIIFLGDDKKHLTGHQLIVRAAILAEMNFYECLFIRMAKKI